MYLLLRERIYFEIAVDHVGIGATGNGGGEKTDCAICISAILQLGLENAVDVEEQRTASCNQLQGIAYIIPLLECG